MNRKTPTRTAFLHIGGPKTGSVTIQKVLRNQPLPDHHYIRVGKANHSPLLSLLFGRGNSQIAPFFRRRGWGPEQLENQRKEWLSELSDEVQGSERDLIFSAEIFCSPIFDEASLETLKTFLAPHVGAIRVIGYVRSPVSYSQSSFQQRLKGVRPVSLELTPVRYIKRFQKFDTVFGRENVTLCHYDRNTLMQGDVVVDIADRLGVDLVDYHLSETNTALSLTAIALLYARQKFGRKIAPYPEYDADTGALLQALEKLGGEKLEGGKLVFGAAILEPMLKKCARDIKWMEKRLGVAIADAPGTPSKGTQAISSEADLLAVAGAAQPQLLTQLGKELPQGAQMTQTTNGPEGAAQLVDQLRAAVSGR